VENVAGLFVHGFATVIGGLAALGYDAEWTTLRASDVGAPHRRERVFIIAYRVADRECSQDHALRGDCDCGWSAVGRGRQAAQRDDGQADTNSPFGCRPELADAEGLADRDERGRAVIGQSEPTWQQSAPRDESDGRGATVAHGTRGGQRIERTEARARDERHVDGGDTGLADSTRWPSRPGEPQHDWEPSRTIASARTQSAVGAVSDGLPVELPRWRRSALEAIGNAIVPQCAEVVAWRVRELLEVTA
jgi:DNA (cytosine-5)-methyltransferase 1